MNIHYFITFLSSILSVSWAWPTGAGDGACEDLTPKHHGIIPQNSQGNSDKFPYVITYRCAPNNSYEVMIHGDQTFQGFLLQARHDLSSERMGWWDIDPGCANITKLKSCSPNVMDSLTHSNSSDKEAVKGIWYPPEKMEGKFYFVGAVLANFTTFWVNLSAKAEVPCVSPPELIEAGANGTSSTNSTIDSPTTDSSNNSTVNLASNSTINLASNLTIDSPSNSTIDLTSTSTIDGSTTNLNNSSTKELVIQVLPKPSAQTGQNIDTGANITIVEVSLVKANLTVTAGNETTADNVTTSASVTSENETTCDISTENTSDNGTLVTASTDNATVQNATADSITTGNTSASAGNATSNDAAGNATSNDAAGNATTVAALTGNSTIDVATNNETTVNSTIGNQPTVNEAGGNATTGNASTVVVTPVNVVAGNGTAVGAGNETAKGIAVLSANITVTDLTSNVTEVKAS